VSSNGWNKANEKLALSYTLVCKIWIESRRAAHVQHACVLQEAVGAEAAKKAEKKPAKAASAPAPVASSTGPKRSKK
jgi:hypothetical protein